MTRDPPDRIKSRTPRKGGMHLLFGGTRRIARPGVYGRPDTDYLIAHAHASSRGHGTRYSRSPTPITVHPASPHLSLAGGVPVLYPGLKCNL